MDFNTSKTTQQWQRLMTFSASQGSNSSATQEPQGGRCSPWGWFHYCPQHFHNSPQTSSLSCRPEPRQKYEKGNLMWCDNCSPILASHWLSTAGTKDSKKVLDFSIRQAKTVAILQPLCDEVMHVDFAQARTAKKLPYRRCETRWASSDLKKNS